MVEVLETMNTQELVDHVKRLDRLYLAADAAFQDWLRESTSVNRRRWWYYRNKYDKAVAEGVRRFGLTDRSGAA